MFFKQQRVSNGKTACQKRYLYQVKPLSLQNIIFFIKKLFLTCFFHFSKWKCQGKSRKYSVTIIVLTFHCLNAFLECNLNFSGVLRWPKVNLKNITLQNFFLIHFFPPQYPRKIQITLEKIVLTAGQNNYGNKIPFLIELSEIKVKKSLTFCFARSNNK